MKINYAILPLVLLMAVTRVHHFGSAFSLPDASLAVFFLAGIYFSSRTLLAGLILEAGMLDYLAINQFAVSDWCISPAYIFLIPTYAVLWLAGRYCPKPQRVGLRPIALKTAWATAAISAAFIISNGSFYLYSGRYADMAVAEYTSAVAQYYLPYLGWALFYTAVGLFAAKAAKLLPSQFQHEEV